MRYFPCPMRQPFSEDPLWTMLFHSIISELLSEQLFALRSLWRQFLGFTTNFESSMFYGRANLNAMMVPLSRISPNYLYCSKKSCSLPPLQHLRLLRRSLRRSERRDCRPGTNVRSVELREIKEITSAMIIIIQLISMQCVDSALPNKESCRRTWDRSLPFFPPADSKSCDRSILFWNIVDRIQSIALET